jgi:hypothetical protein
MALILDGNFGAISQYKNTRDIRIRDLRDHFSDRLFNAENTPQDKLVFNNDQL